MKRKSLYVIIIALFFVGCSKQNLKTVNLSNDCKLNYTIDGNRVVNIEIIQSLVKKLYYICRNKMKCYFHFQILIKNVM